MARPIRKITKPVRDAMKKYRVPQWLAWQIVTAEAGGDVIGIAPDGTRISPAWWPAGTPLPPDARFPAKGHPVVRHRRSAG